MRNAMWVGGGITGMGEIPMLGTAVKGLTSLIRKIFYSGAQGFAYDPNDLTAEKINWRRNLLTETEFRNGISDSSIRAGALSPVAFAGLTVGTGIQVNTSTGGTYIYKSATYKANTPYTFSCYVRMLDGTAPRFGVSSSGSEIDICLVFKGAAYYAEVQDLGGGLYRAYATINSSNTGSYFGVVKYPGNSTKPVNVSGFQLEEGSQLTEYQAFTDFNTEFLRQFPLHALYQDAAGAVPVTAAGQPVGLMLDKSKGLVRGQEVSTDPYFTSPDNWTVIRSSVLDGKLLFTDATTGAAARIKGVTTLGRLYEVTLTVDSLSGALRVSPSYDSNGAQLLSPQITIPGTYTFSILANGVFPDLFIRTVGSSTTAVVSFFSAKEIQGNHAYQTVSASRPILQQSPKLAPNLLPTYDFRTWNAVNSPSPITANSFTTPASGGVRTDILKPNTSYVIELDIENTSTIGIYHGASANTAVASGTRRKVLVQVTTDTGTSFYLRNAAAGTTTVHSIKVQEVIGYRTDQNYLAFDGADDFLQTSNIDFSGTDKVSLFAGVRKLSDATTACVVEFTDGTVTNRGFSLLAPSTGGSYKYDIRLSTNSIGAVTSDSKYNAPNSSVVTGVIGKSSTNKAELRLNAQSINSLALGTFTPSNAPIYIGRRGGTSLPFTGHIYGLIGIGKLVPDSETIAIEKELAKRTGVALNV